ncbi:unnamed protein product [Alopecurus aequalis]
MASRRCFLHLLPTYLSCYLYLATYTAPGAAALSFDYDFTIPRDRAHIKLINASYARTDRIILTDEVPNLTGRVAHRQPVRLWDDRTGRRASFTTTFHFAIHGSSNVSRGDGMAFFIGPFPATTPPPRSDGGLLGLFSKPNTTGDADSLRPPHTVAVEFDTCWNGGWDPLDGGGEHIGIGVNGISSKRTKTLPPLSLYGALWANITYDAESKAMKVMLRTGQGESSWTTYELSTTMDLKDDAGLVQDAAVGFSAATGLLSESHELLAWAFHSTAYLIFVFISSFIHRPSAGSGRGGGEEDAAAIVDVEEEGPKEVRAGDGARNRKNYVHEIETLCQLRHKNLLRLIGWCDDAGRLLLVYELQPNGSISDHLHGSGKTPPLTWPQRYDILLGIASAIEYLHTGAYDSAKWYVLHRDIKPSNVMLGEGFQAKLGDFGLVRQVNRHGGGTPRTTVIGSMDYMDPKYIETGTLSPASDIYSFGVVLLEVASGLKPSVPRGALPGNGHRNSLVAAVRESHNRNAILEMVDDRLMSELEQWRWQMERVMMTGLMCVEPDPEDRPFIKDVIGLLSKPEQSSMPPGRVPGILE